MSNLYTIAAFTENTIGLLNRINIESLSVSETERKGISRFTIVVKTEREMAESLVKNIRKIIEVLAVFAYENDAMVYNEMALFKFCFDKIETKALLENLAEENGARVVFAEKNILIIEKSGTEEEIYTFFKIVKPYDILEFVRSGRIALTKFEKGLSEYLPKAEWSYNI
jgi:acetolactate synthase-1/3 small subunit